MFSTAVSIVIALLVMIMAKSIPSHWNIIIVISKIWATAKMLIFAVISKDIIMLAFGGAMLVYILYWALNPHKLNKLLSYESQMKLQYVIFGGCLLYILAFA